MSHWRLQTLAHPAPQVLEAAAAAASDLGWRVTHLDRPGGHLSLSRARRLGRREWPIDLAVTDSGLGGTVLRVSWESTGSPAWALIGCGRCAGRLCDHVRESLAGGAYL